MQTPDTLADVGKWLGGSVVGLLGAVAVFRARFSVIEERHNAYRELCAEQRKHDLKEVEDLRAEMAAVVTEIRECNSDSKRRQLVTLEIVAHLARKAGVSHRALGTDELSRILSDLPEEGK